jgi:hypothetical protein
MHATAPATLSRVYRYKSWQKCFYGLFGAFFTAGGLSLAASALGRPGAASAVLLAAVVFALGAYMLLLAFRSRIVIDGARIEVRGAFSVRSADLRQIEGFRTLRSRYGSFRQLILRNGGRPITLRPRFRTDDDYRAWMEQVPDLDQRDRQALLAAIEQRQELGATPEERLNALQTAKHRTAALLAIAIAAAIGLNFFNSWLELCAAVLILAPFAAAFLCLRSPLLYAVFKRRSDPRAEASYPLLVSSLGMLYSMREPHFLSFEPLMAAMALSTLALFIVLFDPARKSGNRGAPMALIAFAVLYGLGAAADYDVFFDHSQGAFYTAAVTGRRVAYGRSTQYYLRLQPWGPMQRVAEVSVPSSVYRATSVGDAVCPELHPGRLHAAWFRVRPCPAALQIPKQTPQ